MSKEIINSKNNQKIKSYCDSCEKLEAYQLSENEAKEIIAELEYKIKILEKELKTYKCQEKFPGQCRCACRCLGNEFCIDADKKIEELKEENKRLQELTCPNCGEKLLNPTGAELYDKVLDYKQALEEIREQYVNKAFFKCDKTEEECPCHNCIILGQLDRVQNIIKIIDEVLNEK